MSAIEHADSSLYSYVHEIISAGGGEERRGRDRQSFPTVQHIAPYVDGVLPTRDQLRPVRCQDLSTGGMSFLFEEIPSFDRLVVALASNTQVTYLTAAVAHYKMIDTGGEPLVLVGCRFLGRVFL